MGLEEQLDEADENPDDAVDPDDLPTGDAIAEAFEEYLREQGLE